MHLRFCQKKLDHFSYNQGCVHEQLLVDFFFGGLKWGAFIMRLSRNKGPLAGGNTEIAGAAPKVKPKGRLKRGAPADLASATTGPDGRRYVPVEIDAVRPGIRAAVPQMAMGSQAPVAQSRAWQAQPGPTAIGTGQPAAFGREMGQVADFLKGGAQTNVWMGPPDRTAAAPPPVWSPAVPSQPSPALARAAQRVATPAGLSDEQTVRAMLDRAGATPTAMPKPPSEEISDAQLQALVGDETPSSRSSSPVPSYLSPASVELPSNRSVEQQTASSVPDDNISDDELHALFGGVRMDGSPPPSESEDGVAAALLADYDARAREAEAKIEATAVSPRQTPHGALPE
jgi:hypothetical protein